MIISVNDKTGVSSLCHGITMVDENNKPIPRVMAFDTVTFQCELHGGAVTTAAGFVIPCSNKERLEQLFNGLPTLLQRFICYADQSRIEAKCYAFTADQVNQARYLQDVLNEWED